MTVPHQPFDGMRLAIGDLDMNGRLITSAVKGMLPKNKLAKVQLGRLHVFAGEEHPHTPQKPQVFEIAQVSQQAK